MYKETYERDAKTVFNSAVASVLPKAMLESALTLDGNVLKVIG